ncbi:MAG TPA: peptidoglycan bridge formation glycyltransferase FemA/FemB family protein [Chloroflexota bacterium]|nr:peptidoglycan bridge formation glycyltransferase FemA/FemB family protein [Chloroflexota bacterium]
MTVTVCRWSEADAWNQFVSTVPEAHFQQSWQWGELAPALGAQALRLAAVDGDRIVGALQLLTGRLGGRGPSHFYAPRGPALAEPRRELLAPLLEAACDLGREMGIAGIRLEPNVAASTTSWRVLLGSVGLRPTFPPSQPRSSWMLDITPGEEKLLAGMKQKTRYNIRLAEKKGVEISTGGIADLDEFYALYQETARRDGFFIHDRAVYRRTFEIYASGGEFELLLARFEGELIAAITTLRFGGTCWYVHGASSNRHRNLMATYGLQWIAIQRARNAGCRLYDFRAVPDVLSEDQDMYGVYRFKEGFGGYHVTTLETYGAPYRPALYGAWDLALRGRFLLDRWQRRRRGLPARQFA